MADEVEAAKADIEKTREELQETVDQLTDRLDPRVRAREAGESVKQTAADGVAKTKQVANHGVQTAKDKPVPVAAIALAVVAAVVGVVVWRRRSR
ncbi:DUF3618 domain-containing protein [Jatrophihabitans sp. YIM 134969]